MGQEYLMDTNIVIDYLGNKMPDKAAVFIESIFPNISVITRIEIVGWLNAAPEQTQRLQSYIDTTTIHPLDENTILKTIAIRQLHRIKLPDAIIAATALVYNLCLLTRNANDFKNIDGLKICNPWKKKC